MRNNIHNESMRHSVIRKLRKEAGLTQIQLAVAVGVAIGTVQRWELKNGKATMPALTPSEWIRFCRALGLQWSDIPRYFVYESDIQ